MFDVRIVEKPLEAISPPPTTELMMAKNQTEQLNNNAVIVFGKITVF